MLVAALSRILASGLSLERQPTDAGVELAGKRWFGSPPSQGANRPLHCTNA
jgi:hypothetical protein